MTSLAITKEDVIRQIVKLKPNKSPGPDEVFARVLKECKEELSEPLSTIFNKSLELGIVPESWKVANVIPIFMSGIGWL